MHLLLLQGFDLSTALPQNYEMYYVNLDYILAFPEMMMDKLPSERGSRELSTTRNTFLINAAFDVFKAHKDLQLFQGILPHIEEINAVVVEKMKSYYLFSTWKSDINHNYSVAVLMHARIQHSI